MTVKADMIGKLNVTFRQFAFLSDQANVAGTDGGDMYFHCFVKVCGPPTVTPTGASGTNEATCSKTDIEGNSNTCSSTVIAAPSRRRRQADDVPSAVDLNSKVVKGPVKNRHKVLPILVASSLQFLYSQN